jgi:putative heme transporter
MMPSPWTLRRIAAATLTIIASFGLAWALFTVRDTLILVFVGVLFGLAIKGPVGWLQRRRVPRPLAIAIVLLLVLAAIPVVLVLLLPTLVNAIVSVVTTALEGYNSLAAQIPDLSDNTLVNIDELITQLGSLVASNSERLVGSFVGLGTSILSGVFNLVTIITIGFLWILEEEHILAWIVNLTPARYRADVREVWGELQAQLGGYIRGLVVLSLVVGLLCGVGYLVGGLRLAAAFAILAALFEMIPIPGVGLVLTGLVVGLASFADSPTQALIGVVWTVVVFQFANMVLFPRILGQAVGISALGVVVALMVFVSLLGAVGALLAIPLAGIIQILLNQLFIRSRRPVQGVIPSTIAGPPPSVTPIPVVAPPTSELARLRERLAADPNLGATEREVALSHLDAALEAVTEPTQA